MINNLIVFVLAAFLGYELISKVPQTLHTPLMSGANAISGITVVGALTAAGMSGGAWTRWLGATALLGWVVLGLHPATAILLGAVVAPTDPVLASTVEATPPTKGVDEEVDPTDQEGEIRFALTSEAGLNDGLAFPFTNLAIVLAGATALSSGAWFADWALYYVLYKIIVGVIGGVLVGYFIAKVVFGRHSTTDLARVMEGGEALAATLLAYATTELVSGYGFIAVFVAALVLRNYEWKHDYYEKLHDFGVVAERLLMSAVLVLFGGAVADGLLSPLTLTHAGIGLALILVIRPLAGMVGLVGADGYWRERAIVASYGVRGIGSFYYLAHALNAASFQEFELVVAGDELWAILGFVVIASLAIHGISAAPVMGWVDRWRAEHKEEFVMPEEAD